MKKSITTNTLLLFLATLSVSAQNFQGKIYYSSKSKVHSVQSMESFTEDQKAAIKKGQDAASAKKYVLEFNKKHSLFTENTKLSLLPTRPMRSGGGMMMINSPGNFYKDLLTKTYVNQKDLFGKQFIIQDDLETIAWKKTDEVKTIGKYVCFKATAQIANTNKYDDDNQGETITVVAWFTLDIPVSQGPGMYWGLPGLILEVQSEDVVYLCTKIELTETDDIVITAPKGGKKISNKKFDTLFAQRLQALKDRHTN